MDMTDKDTLDIDATVALRDTPCEQAQHEHNIERLILIKERLVAALVNEVQRLKYELYMSRTLNIEPLEEEEEEEEGDGEGEGEAKEAQEEEDEEDFNYEE
jgi:hypothetical protein